MRSIHMSQLSLNSVICLLQSKLHIVKLISIFNQSSSSLQFLRKEGFKATEFYIFIAIP